MTFPQTDSPVHHLLCVAYFFPPSGGAGVQRPLKFVKYLPNYGWRSHVLTVHDGAFFADDPTLLGEVDATTEIIRTPSWEVERLPWLRAKRRAHSSGTAIKPSRGARLLRGARTWILPDPQIGWFPHAMRAAAALLRRQHIDAIWTTSTPFTSHLIGLALKQRFDLPWVADFRDPWSEDPQGLLGHHRVHAFLERQVIERADRVVGVNHGITDFLRNRDRQNVHGKYHVIPNGFDADDFNAVPAPNTPFDDGAWHITMTGSVYAKTTVTPFLHALAQFHKSNPTARVRMHWVGQMDRQASADYAQTVAALGLEDVCERVGYVPHGESIRWLVRSHLLLLPMFAGTDAYNWMPGKMFEYLASKTPVLLCADAGIASTLLREARAGVVVHPLQTEAMAAALQRLYEAHKSGIPLTERDDAVVSRYERRVLTSQLATLLDSLVPARATRAAP